MYKPANLKKNLGVGAWVPIVIHPTGDGAATKKFLATMGEHSTLTIRGVKFNREELAAVCAELPPVLAITEEEREAEYAAQCAVTGEA